MTSTYIPVGSPPLISCRLGESKVSETGKIIHKLTIIIIKEATFYCEKDHNLHFIGLGYGNITNCVLELHPQINSVGSLPDKSQATGLCLLHNIVAYGLI